MNCRLQEIIISLIFMLASSLSMGQNVTRHKEYRLYDIVDASFFGQLETIIDKTTTKREACKCVNLSFCYNKYLISSKDTQEIDKAKRFYVFAYFIDPPYPDGLMIRGAKYSYLVRGVNMRTINLFAKSAGKIIRVSYPKPCLTIDKRSTLTIMQYYKGELYHLDRILYGDLYHNSYIGSSINY